MFGSQNIANCFLCENGNETVDHFLLKCTKYDGIRNESFDKIQSVDSNFFSLDERDKVRYIISAKCPAENIGHCCQCLNVMYKQREIDNILRPALSVNPILHSS